MSKIKDNLRLNFQYLVQKVVKDGKVPLTVVRQGKAMPVDVPVKTHYPMLIESLKGKYPSYFIYGPLAFSPVTAEFASVFDRAGTKRGLHFGCHGQPARPSSRRPAPVRG